MCKLGLKIIMLVSVLLIVIPSSKSIAETTNCTVIGMLPYTITAQGVYCFKKHLATNMTEGNAIEINTNNVVIDLNGYKLGGLAAGDSTRAYGIYAHQRKNITLKNGTIRGFSNAIRLTDSYPYTTSEGHVIEDIRADKNTWIALHIQGRGNIVRNNIIVDTGGSTNSNSPLGIWIEGPGNRIFNNEIVDTVTTAVGGYPTGMFVGGDGCIAEQNNISNSNVHDSIASSGIHFANYDDFLAIGNNILGYRNGINMLGSAKYRDNTTSNVTSAYSGGTDIGNNN